MNTRNKRPIGVFDSGVGGLTVVKSLRKMLPGEDIIYLGDTARVPYGTKSKDTVTRFSIDCLKFLKKFDIKLAIVACNTASSWSLETVKRKFNFPVIGVIKPGVKKACVTTKNNRVGVIGTNATVTSRSYEKEIKKISKKIKVSQKACPLFVPLVEENWIKGKVVLDVMRTYLDELKNKDIDTLILGCTHYPILKEGIKKVIGEKTEILDSSISVSEEVKCFLKKHNIANSKTRKSKVSYFVTDDPNAFKKVSGIFLKTNISVKKVDIS